MKKNILLVWAFLCYSLISYAQFTDNVDLMVFAYGKNKSDAIEKANKIAVDKIFSDLISSAEIPFSISEFTKNTPFDIVLEVEDSENNYGAVLLDVHVSTNQLYQWAMNNDIETDYAKSQSRWSRILPEYTKYNQLSCAKAFKAIIPYYAIDAFNYNLIVQPLETHIDDIYGGKRSFGIVEISVEYFANEKTSAFDRLLSKMLEKLNTSNDTNMEHKVSMPVYVNGKWKNETRYYNRWFLEELSHSVFQPYTLVFGNRVFRHNPKAYANEKKVMWQSGYPTSHYYFPNMFAGEAAKKKWKYDGLLFVITSSFKVPLKEYDRMSSETIQIYRNPFNSICIEGLVDYFPHGEGATKFLEDASNESMASGFNKTIERIISFYK